MTDTVTATEQWRHLPVTPTHVTADVTTDVTVTADGMTLHRQPRHVIWHVTHDAADVMRAMRHTFPKTVTPVTEEDRYDD